MYLYNNYLRMNVETDNVTKKYLGINLKMKDVKKE